MIFETIFGTFFVLFRFSPSAFTIPEPKANPKPHLTPVHSPFSFCKKTKKQKMNYKKQKQAKKLTT